MITDKIVSFELAKKLFNMGIFLPGCSGRYAIDNCEAYIEPLSGEPAVKNIYNVGDFIMLSPHLILYPEENLILAPTLQQAKEYLTTISGCPIETYVFFAEGVCYHEGFYKTQKQRFGTENSFTTEDEAVEDVCKYLADVLNHI